jgi:hypothetical protein
MEWLQTGLGLVIGFTKDLQIVTKVTVVAKFIHYAVV